MMQVRFLEEAQNEFFEQVAYYEEQQAGLGARFRASVEAAAALAAVHPMLGSPWVLGTRRIFPRNVPFAIVYRIESTKLIVFAVAHFRRKPTYWRGRTQPIQRHPSMNTSIHSQWVPLGQDGSTGFEGLLTLPPAGQGPGLLLWQEIFGVNAHIRRVAEQYAQAGFVVLAPDVFWRSEARVELGYGDDGIARGRVLMGAIPAEAVRTDVETAARALRARPEVAGGRIGSVGYCFGGRLAYFSAAWAGADAAVCYYGGGIHDHLALAAGIRGDLLLHYAQNDSHIPPDAVERVRAATVSSAQPGNACHVYPGTMHGFNCWERGSYAPAASALALGRSLTFLAERLF